MPSSCRNSPRRKSKQSKKWEMFFKKYRSENPNMPYNDAKKQASLLYRQNKIELSAAIDSVEKSSSLNPTSLNPTIPLHASPLHSSQMSSYIDSGNSEDTVWYSANGDEDQKLSYMRINILIQQLLEVFLRISNIERNSPKDYNICQKLHETNKQKLQIQLHQLVQEHEREIGNLIDAADISAENGLTKYMEDMMVIKKDYTFKGRQLITQIAEMEKHNPIKPNFPLYTKEHEKTERKLILEEYADLQEIQIYFNKINKLYNRISNGESGAIIEEMQNNYRQIIYLFKHYRDILQYMVFLRYDILSYQYNYVLSLPSTTEIDKDSLKFIVYTYQITLDSISFAIEEALENINSLENVINSEL